GRNRREMGFKRIGGGRRGRHFGHGIAHLPKQGHSRGNGNVQIGLLLCRLRRHGLLTFHHLLDALVLTHLLLVTHRILLGHIGQLLGLLCLLGLHGGTLRRVECRIRIQIVIVRNQLHLCTLNRLLIVFQLLHNLTLTQGGGRLVGRWSHFHFAAIGMGQKGQLRHRRARRRLRCRRRLGCSGFRGKGLGPLFSRDGLSLRRTFLHPLDLRRRQFATTH